MLGRAKAIYLATRKRNDQLFNKYFMRPLAAGVVAIVDGTPVMPDQLTLLSTAVFVIAAGALNFLPPIAGL